MDTLPTLGPRRSVIITSFMNNDHPQLFNIFKNRSRILESKRFSGELKSRVVSCPDHVTIFDHTDVPRSQVREFRVGFPVFCHLEYCWSVPERTPARTKYLLPGAEKTHFQPTGSMSPRDMRGFITASPSISRRGQGRRRNGRGQSWKVTCDMLCLYLV